MVPNRTSTRHAGIPRGVTLGPMSGPHRLLPEPHHGPHGPAPDPCRGAPPGFPPEVRSEGPEGAGAMSPGAPVGYPDPLSRPSDDPFADDSFADGPGWLDGGDDLRPTPMYRIRRSGPGTVLAAAMLGLAGVIEGRPPREDVTIVSEAPDEPFRRVELHLDPVHRERSLVIVHAGASPDGPAPRHAADPL